LKQLLVTIPKAALLCFIRHSIQPIKIINSNLLAAADTPAAAAAAAAAIAADDMNALFTTTNC
jgi:hypothetical protein